MKKILILASNPQGDLRIDREIRDLEKAIERHQNAKEFEVEVKLAVQPEDLQELLYDNQAYIVHFTGHGVGKDGLVFENEYGGHQLLSNEALSGLFRLCGQNVECVLLNACQTEVQADLIVEHIPYAIGTSREILDRAAYWYTVGFYKALVRGQTIEQSFEWGCNAIQINLPNVRIQSEINEPSRKLQVVLPDGSKVEKEPLKIILKQNSSLSQAEDSTNSKTTDIKQAIIAEAEIQQYKDTTRQAVEQFGQGNLIKRELISQHQYRQRKTLLNKVKDFWIDGFLKPSLYRDLALNLDSQTRPDAVLHSWQNLEVLPVELDESFDSLQQTDIAEQIGEGKTLLILGEPGSGKTITLLQLAEKLVQQSEADLTKPIPVVFNLSSWGQTEQSIDSWLIEELIDKYQVPQALSEPWLKEEQLTLLLDGLDEVQLDKCNACVQALNQYILDHSATEIVVCCRVKDYEALTARLQLSSAICLQPLSRAKIFSFLDEAGDSFVGLKTLLQRDAELAKFAQTPLILNIMTLAYQNWSAEELLQEFHSRENPYEHLFDSYIKRMLSRRINSQESKSKSVQYSLQQVTRWLSWLAKSMVKESTTVFFIEKMQPSLLPEEKLRRKYRILFGLRLGVMLGLMLGLIGGLIGGLVGPGALIRGLITGLIGGIIIGLIDATTKNNEIKHKTFSNQGIESSQNNYPEKIKILIYGLFYGSIFVLIYTFNFKHFITPKYLLIVSLVGGLMGVLIARVNDADGKTDIQHSTLRLMLYRQGCIPWNYARFLDYASDRLLMKKVGGGYVFYHRMLMEHFAKK